MDTKCALKGSTQFARKSTSPLLTIHSQSAPLLPVLPAQHTPLLLHGVSPHSHTLPPPSLTHSFCSVHLTRKHKLCKMFNEGRDGDKGPTCLCLQFNTNKSEGCFNGEQASSLSHCFQQSHICKSNRGCAHG